MDIVFTGHEHLYLWKTVDGVMHIITGGGGASLYAGAEKGDFYHFIPVKAGEKHVTGRVIDIKGKVIDTFER